MRHTGNAWSLAFSTVVLFSSAAALLSSHALGTNTASLRLMKDAMWVADRSLSSSQSGKPIRDVNCRLAADQSKADSRDQFLVAATALSGAGTLFKIAPISSKGGIVFDSFVTLWSYSEVSATIDAPVGIYELQVHGKNARPGPVILELVASYGPFNSVVFDRDDDSWETKCVPFYPGYWPEFGRAGKRVVIGLRFINDLVDERGDRNASIAWIRLVPIRLKAENR